MFRKKIIVMLLLNIVKASVTKYCKKDVQSFDILLNVRYCMYVWLECYCLIHTSTASRCNDTSSSSSSAQDVPERTD